MQRRIFTVGEVNEYIKSLLEQDFALRHIWIKGELSNCKIHTSGHIYFTIKDPQSILSCIMFRSYASLVPFKPENGMAVVLKGYISVYEKTGQYQLYVEQMEPEGKGALYVAFEQLKQKLSHKGYFDPIYKKPIPKYPASIGIITSQTGAAIRDMIQIATRRNPSVQLILYPVLVQGREASQAIAQAIHKMNRLGEVDLLIIGRGGGSLEDLWAFNEEIVAKAIFESTLPIISAVGHETDFTISDFVSDLRAPTPSAAIELCIPDANDVQTLIDSYRKMMKTALARKIERSHFQLHVLQNKKAFQKPLDRVYTYWHHIEQIENFLNTELQHRMSSYSKTLSHNIAKLETLSPMGVLQRGYALLQSKEGVSLRSISSVHPGDEILITIQDGAFFASIHTIHHENGVSLWQEKNK